MIYMGIYYKKMSLEETFWGQNEFKTSYKFLSTTFDHELKAKCLRQSDESDGGSWIVDYPTCNLSRYTSLRLVEFEEDIVLY